jgi:hypothetical protein
MNELPAVRLHGAVRRPRVSFVIAWQGCATELSRRLRLWGQWVEIGIDVVVVCSCPAAERQRIERLHPDVRVVKASAEEDMSVLRQLGVSAAQGDIVVIVDDAVGWTASWRDHLPAAIVGPVVPAARAQWLGYDRAALSLDEATLR